jgi:hypothetical protein
VRNGINDEQAQVDPAPVYRLYLLQQEDPSSGWAQHAPLLSSFDSLGVQHTAASLFLGVQQEEAATTFSSFLPFAFFATGISEIIVSIVSCVICLKDESECRMMQLS